MTDNRNDNKGRPRKPGGGKGPRRPAGGKPFAGKSFDAKSSDRPDKPRPPRGDFKAPRDGSKGKSGGEATLRRRPDSASAPRGAPAPKAFPRDGEIVPRPRPAFEKKPFRPRSNEAERPFREREGQRPRQDRPERPPFKPRKARGPASTVRTVERAEGEERIARIMARAGLCSRRDAEEWIGAGRVEINGEKILSPARNAGPGDRILVDGKPLPGRERTRLWMFHKPKGLVTTSSDPEGRPTIFEALPEDLPRVVSIGRLDINTEGLLLLTNDGGLSRLLELPSTGWLRRYRVRAHGETDQAKLDALREGITIEGIDYAGIEARLDRAQGANVWLTMGLREGKNREIKKVLEHLGLAVNRLIRLSFGPFQLGDLEEGAVEEVKTRILKDQLGDKMIAESGADFDTPPLEAARAASQPEARETRAAAPRPERQGRPERPDHQERPSRPARGAMREPADEPPERRPERPQPGKRKHISILRAERREEAAGERKRVERAQTADRKGRTVRVERVVAARPKAAAPEDNRNARRFRGERDGAPANRAADRAEPRARAPRREGERPAFRKPREAGERPAFRKPREEGGRSQAPRAEGGRPPGRDRAAEPGGKPFAGKPFARKPFAGKPFGDKSFAGKPSGHKPSGGKFSGDRPPRRDAPDGARPFRGKPGGRPGGKPGGKPGGDRPRGPRPPRREG